MKRQLYFTRCTHRMVFFAIFILHLNLIFAQQVHVEGIPLQNSIQLDQAGINGIQIDSTFRNGIVVNNTGSAGIVINQTGGEGLLISSTSDNGISINDVAGDGIDIDAGDVGIDLHDQQLYGLRISDAANFGLSVFNSGLSGITVSGSGVDGLFISDPSDDGLHVTNAGDNGVESHNSTGNGFYSDGSGSSSFVSEDAGINGFQSSHSALNGFSTEYAGGNGFVAKEASNHAFYSEFAGSDGFRSFKAMDDGFSSAGAGGDGFAAIGSEKNGFYSLGSTEAGFYSTLSDGHGYYAVFSEKRGFLSIFSGEEAGYFLNADTSSHPSLYVSHGNDMNHDLSFGGHARISSKGSYHLQLDDNGNSSTDKFEVLNTGGTAVFNVNESGNGGVTGNFSKGGGSFKIDHPLDPQNKYLYHSFVESPDMMNVYNWNIVLDENGEATVVLPEYFEALNRDFRYQLTCVGGFAQIYIGEKLNNNFFKISGGHPDLEVSWQITGIRQDAFADHNRIPTVVNKESHNKGNYLHADAWAKKLNIDNLPSELDYSEAIDVEWQKEMAEVKSNMEKELEKQKIQEEERSDRQN